MTRVASTRTADTSTRVAIPNLQNRLLWSDDYTNAVWTLIRVTLAPLIIVGPPDFGVLATGIIADTNNSTHLMLQTYTPVAGDFLRYAASVFAKAGDQTFCLVAFDGGASAAWFNLAAGTVGTVIGSGTSATIEDSGDGWYRCTITGPYVNSVATPFFVTYAAPSDASLNFAGDGATPSIYLIRSMLGQGANWTGPSEAITEGSAINTGPIRSLASGRVTP